MKIFYLYIFFLYIKDNLIFGTISFIEMYKIK